MASYNFIRNSSDVLRSFTSFDENYFNELREFGSAYNVSSTCSNPTYALYLDRINNEANALYEKAHQICSKQIYYQSYPEGHAKVDRYARELITSLNALHQFLQNNTQFNVSFYLNLKLKVESFYENLREFCEQFSMMKEDYRQYVSGLPKSSG